ncbi:MAG: thioesterase family protein [Verrucomicrobiota bacterium JB024]|nr:thioesterase family protein [Verrucomicrobiota bacterium JB024]
MAEPFIYRRIVDFAETDMAGIAHFSNYFRWMEAAESALLREVGVPLTASDGVTDYGWPRVRASCSYHEPVRYSDELEVQLHLKTIKVKALEYVAKFYVGQGDERRHVATGKMTSVYVCKPTAGGPMQSLALTPAMLERLAPLAEEVLT